MSSCFFVHRHLSWMSQCSFIPPLHCSKHCLSLWSTRRSWRPQRCTWKVNELCENTGCGMWCVIVTVPSRCWSRELFGVKFLLDWTVATAIKTRVTDWWFHMVKYLSYLSWNRCVSSRSRVGTPTSASVLSFQFPTGVTITVVLFIHRHHQMSPCQHLLWVLYSWAPSVCLCRKVSLPAYF